ncbi:DNA polymerase Y family protein [Actinoplanes aureus]|uniref:DNA polymerase Y family protein n=1 Tax=Actinoplanes aureus TaxID=2792083 RepID=UPI0028158498|nr:DNA polymerase Y family protein [Actinoplanes aureus]
MRTLLVWCPDWPIVAAEIVEGVAAGEAVVVLSGNRVLACSEAARREGVRRGLRRREAQSRCPWMTVVEHDPGRDARAFEPVVAAIEEVVAGVEVIRAGACAVAVRGPARYFGGEEAAAERIVEQVAQACAVECQVGIAEGVFAAGIAARTGRVVPPGETREFLSGVPVEALERPELTDLLHRLGIKTLGQFAALPAGDVLTRFGFDGALAHRLASGADHRPLAVRKPPLDLAVEDTYDEPLERVDVAAFAGRVLAERLHEGLAAHGLACTRLGVEAVTVDGQELFRMWRHDGTLTATAIADRVRWQLDGWLTGARRGVLERPTAGLVRLRLVPDGVLVHLGLQAGLWGETGAERDRAHRVFSRVQGLLGPNAVVTPVLGGGRSADDQVRLVPWGDEREPSRPGAAHIDPIPGAGPEPPAAPALRLVRSLPREAAQAAPPTAAGAVPAAVSGAASAAVAGKETPGSSGDLASVVRLRPPEQEREQTRPAAVTRLRPVPVIPAEPGGGARPGGGRGGPVPAEVPDIPAEPGGGGRPGGGPGGPAAASFPVPGPVKRPGRRSARQIALPPWPGRLPRPAPAVVPGRPATAVVLDAAGRPVGVSARLELTGPPVTVAVERGAPAEIVGWAGPWPVDERWWADGEARRRARFQVMLAGGRALLLSLAGGQWVVEAVYD